MSSVYGERSGVVWAKARKIKKIKLNNERTLKEGKELKRGRRWRVRMTRKGKEDSGLGKGSIIHF
jgi:hypothetical protein